MLSPDLGPQMQLPEPPRRRKPKGSFQDTLYRIESQVPILLGTECGGAITVFVGKAFKNSNPSLSELLVHTGVIFTAGTGALLLHKVYRMITGDLR